MLIRKADPTKDLDTACFEALHVNSHDGGTVPATMHERFLIRHQPVGAG